MIGGQRRRDRALWRISAGRTVPFMSKPWKCRLGWHSWVRYEAPNPSARKCRRCDKKTIIGHGVFGPMGPGGN